jgi:hypothetical protein
MPPWLLLIVSLLGLSSVVPLFVLAITGGNWRAAVSAWWQYGKVMAALALPGFVIWLGYLMWPPLP